MHIRSAITVFSTIVLLAASVWAGEMRPALPPRAVAVPPLEEMLVSQMEETAEKAAVGLEVRSLCIVQGNDFTLGEIAKLQNIDADRRRRLTALEVGRSPRMGARLVMSASQIERALERIGVAEPEFELKIPDRVTLEREVQELDVEAFRGRVIEALLQKLPFESENVIIDRMHFPRKMLLPVGQVSERLRFRMPGRPTGTVLFDAEILIDGTLYQRLTGSVEVDLWVDALRAKDVINRGSALAPLAVEKARIRLSDVRGEPLLAEDLRPDFKVRRDLKPGDVITTSSVEREILVSQGNAVRMILERDGMRIATVGVSRGRGSLGDFVEVANAKSGKRLRAVVIGRNAVRVPF